MSSERVEAKEKDEEDGGGEYTLYKDKDSARQSTTSSLGFTLKSFPQKSVASRYSFNEDAEISASVTKKGNSGEVQLAPLNVLNSVSSTTTTTTARESSAELFTSQARPRRSTYLNASKKQSLASLRASRMSKNMLKMSTRNLKASKDMLLGIPQHQDDEEIVIERFRPMMTYAIIVVNCLVFFIMMCVNSWVFEKVSLNPTLGPSASFLLSFGAKLTILEVHYGQGWRLISSMFLHGGFVHLLLNMLTFYRIGADVEEYCGKKMSIFVYLVSGFSGQVASSVFNPRLIGVGASGAIYGFLGLLFGDFVQNHQTIVEEKWKYFASLVFSLIFGFLIGLLPIVDNWAHMGGFFMGFLLGVLFLTNDECDEDGRRLLPWYSNIARIISFVLALLWLISMLIILFKTENGNSVCSWCKYLDCFDTSWWTCPDQG